MIYFVYGSQISLIKQRISKLTNEFIPQLDEFSVDTFDLNFSDIDQVISSCNTLPLFADKKVVVVKNLYIEKCEKAIRRLTEYLENENPSCRLIFEINSNQVIGTQLFNKLSKNELVVFDKTMDVEEKDWKSIVLSLANKRNVSFEPDALEEFLDRCNLNIQIALNNLEKLSNLNSVVTYKDVCDLVEKPLEDNIFNMLDYFLNNELDKAFSLYEDLLIQGVDVVTIISNMATQLRFLFQVKHLYNLGLSQERIASELKQKSGRVYYAIKKINSINENDILSYLNMIAEIDYATKTGNGDPKQLFELFLAGRR